MSQEYTEDKVITLKKLTGGQRLLEAFLLLAVIFSAYIMAALLSFDTADPSWSQTAWHEPIHNIGGRIGAWIADVLLFVCGVVAYILPPAIFLFCWSLFRNQQYERQTDLFMLALRIIGLVALILSTCALAAMNLDDWYHFASGGVLGSLLTSALLPVVSHVSATLILLAIWAAGFTLFTGWSWLVIVEKLGWLVMSVLTFITNVFRSSSDRVQEPSLSEPEQQEIILTHDSVPADGVTTDNIAAVTQTQSIQPSVLPDDSSTSHKSAAPANYDRLHLFAQREESLKAIQQNTEQQTITAPSLETLSALDSDQQLTEQPMVYAKQESSNNLDQLIANRDSPARLSTQSLSNTQSSERVEPLISKQNLFAPSTDSPDQDEALNKIAQAFQPTIEWHSAAPFSQYEDDSAQSALFSTDNDINRSLHHLTAIDFSDHPLASDNNDHLINDHLINDHLINVSQPKEIEPYIDTKHLFNQQQSEENLQQSTEMAVDRSQLPPSNNIIQPAKQRELPRPKPVRIPTRRELMSYGIKLPSQREAEAKQREQQLSHQNMNQYSTDEQYLQQQYSEQLEQENLQREFALQQQQRYGQDYKDQQSSDIEKMPEYPIAADMVDNHTYQNVVEQDEVNSQDDGYQRVGQLDDYDAIHNQTDVINTKLQSRVGNDDIAPVVQQNAEQTDQQHNTQVSDSTIHDSLIHPFLMRNDQPLQKPTTPLPTLALLSAPPASRDPINMQELQQLGRLVEERLGDYRVKANVVGILPGPVITLFELDLAPGVKAARISNLARDLARSLSAVAVRVVEVIPGRPYVGLELPNKHRQTVYLREVLDCVKFRDMASPLAIVLGQDISGQPVVADLAKMPHVLVAGTTGSGKSVGVNAMIISMLYKATPDEVRFIMIDPKMLELSVYEGIPHLLTEVVTDMKDAANALRWCVGEMEHRYKLMSALGVRNLAGYNERVEQAEQMGRPIPNPFWKPTDSMELTAPVLEKLPYIVVIVDEFADLMMAVGKKVEELIARLAQKARAAGIHLVLATQRPSVDVITGLIKANIPTRIAFTVSSKIDSRTILDQAGAESLLGMGDMLYLAPNSSMPIRVHGAFVRDEEVHAVVQDWKARGKPQYIDNIITAPEESENGFTLDGDEPLDPLYDQAVAFVIEKRKASISGVQRQFRIGYNRAARIIEQMEAQGTVSAPGHNGNREVLAPPPYE